jgi:hypothetical protein
MTSVRHRMAGIGCIGRLKRSDSLKQGSSRNSVGDDTRGTGYDVIVWIEEAVALQGFVPPVIKIHSANPSAVEKMQAGVQGIQRLMRERSMHRDIWA